MDRASKSSFVELRLEVQEKVLNVSAVVARKDHDIARNDSQVSLQMKRRAQIYSPLQQIPNKSDMAAIRKAPYKQYLVPTDVQIHKVKHKQPAGSPLLRGALKG